jgi:hypothetical protein
MRNAVFAKAGKPFKKRLRCIEQRGLLASTQFFTLKGS